MEGREPSQLLVDPNDNAPFPQIKRRSRVARSKDKPSQKSGLNRRNIWTSRGSNKTK